MRGREHTAGSTLMAYCSERIRSKVGKGKCGAKSSGKQGKGGSGPGQGVIRAPAISRDCGGKPERRAVRIPEKRELQRGDPNIPVSQRHLTNC